MKEICNLLQKILIFSILFVWKYNVNFEKQVNIRLVRFNIYSTVCPIKKIISLNFWTSIIFNSHTHFIFRSYSLEMFKSGCVFSGSMCGFGSRKLLRQSQRKWRWWAETQSITSNNLTNTFFIYCLILVFCFSFVFCSA